MCLKPQLRGILWRKRGWYHELGVNFDTYIWGLKSIFLRGSNFWKNIEFKHSRVLLLQKGVMSHKCTECYKIYANIKKNWELNPCVPWECSMYLKNLHNMQLPEHVLTKKKNTKCLLNRKRFDTFPGYIQIIFSFGLNPLDQSELQG